MRIITGCAKGMKLKAPRGLATRPTTDRVKESLFNILGPIVEDAIILDLFAGTGGLGLEALSRGARHAIFVDHSSTSISIIKENAANTQLTMQSEFCKNDVIKAVQRLKQENKLFDIIFCDPPYNQGWVFAVLSLLDNNSVIQPEGIVIFEHSRHEMVGNEWDTLREYRTERYGETVISFFKREDNKALGG